MKYIENDGGRARAGFKGTARDCVIRAISIASMTPYKEVFSVLNDMCKDDDPTDGILTRIYSPYLFRLGFKFILGDGQKKFDNAFNRGPARTDKRYIIKIRNHLVACIGEELHDIFDSRGGSKEIIGYWVK